MTDSLMKLEPGQTFSRTTMLNLGSDRKREATIRREKQKLRNIMAKQVGRAAEREDGRVFRLDTGTWLAAEDATVFITVAISRVI